MTAIIVMKITMMTMQLQHSRLHHHHPEHNQYMIGVLKYTLMIIVSLMTMIIITLMISRSVCWCFEVHPPPTDAIRSGLASYTGQEIEQQPHHRHHHYHH